MKRYDRDLFDMKDVQSAAQASGCKPSIMAQEYEYSNGPNGEVIQKPVLVPQRLYVWAANIGYIVNGVMVKRTDAIRNSLQESTKDCPPFPVDFRTYPDGSIVVTDVERDFSVYVEYSTQLVHHIGK